MKVRSLAAFAALFCTAMPALAQRQNLTHVELIALQQQLRDDGCGVDHVTGAMDAPTRSAIKKCMARYDVTSGGARDLLYAMHIGFGPDMPEPALAQANPDGTTNVSSSTAVSMNTRNAMRSSMRRRMTRDSAMMQRDTIPLPPRDTMPRDTIPMPPRDTMPMPPRDTMPMPPRDTIPPRDTVPPPHL